MRPPTREAATTIVALLIIIDAAEHGALTVNCKEPNSESPGYGATDGCISTCTSSAASGLALCGTNPDIV